MTLTVFAIVQSGRLQFEALAFVASFVKFNPNFDGRLVLMEPQPNQLWDDDPRIDNDIRTRLIELGAEIHPFHNSVFGQRYPNANKIEALLQLPTDGPFIFFDTDTVFMGAISEIPFDFSKPTASSKRTATWPQPGLYGPNYEEIWASMYKKFDLDFQSSKNLDWPENHWRRYMYFNAGWFFYEDAKIFGDLYLKFATELEDDPPAEVAAQELYPWLDQAVLPLVIHALGGGRRTIPDGLLDGKVSCHYRLLPLLFAKESDAAVEAMRDALSHNKTKKLAKGDVNFKEFVFQKRGEKARALFDQESLPKDEAKIRKRLKNHKLWIK